MAALARRRLNRDFIAPASARVGSAVDLPPAAAVGLPERAVQFGTGALLRGLVEPFIDASNRRGVFGGSIVAVSSTGSGRDDTLNDQDGLYTLVVRGLVDGAPVDCRRVIGSLSRVLSAATHWNAVLDVAHDPNIALVFSNTTEIGIVLDEGDDALDPPRSFPGKLTRFLYERAVVFDYDPRRGVVVLPCELIENNGKVLGRIVRTLAGRWQLGARFDHWLTEGVTFCNTLVDRIVTGAPSAADARALSAAVEYEDAMITICEPYRLFAIEGGDALRSRLRFADTDDGVTIADDIAPFRERKVRVLNGAHTIGVSVALLCGIETVRAAIQDARVGAFLRRVVFDEIVPSLSVPDGESFAAAVFERFANPFIEHALIDITLQGTMKMRTRIVPSILGHSARAGRAPHGLALGFAAFLFFLRGDIHSARAAAGRRVPADAQAEAIRRCWRDVDVASDDSLTAFVEAVIGNETLWGDGLSHVPGFAADVAEHLARVSRQGMAAALDAYLATPPA